MPSHSKARPNAKISNSFSPIISGKEPADRAEEEERRRPSANAHAAAPVFGQTDAISFTCAERAAIGNRTLS